MFKSLRDWYIREKTKKAKQAKEDRDRDEEWEEIRESRKIIIPAELLKKFIIANAEYMQDRVQPIYFPNGQFWYNINYCGNKECMLQDNIKTLIYENLKRGVPYDKIIEQLSDPNFKFQEEQNEI